VQVESRCYHQGKKQISIIKSWRQEGHPVNGNKQKRQILVVILTTRNRPTLPQYGKEGVVLYGLDFRDVNDDDDNNNDDDDIYIFIYIYIFI